MKKILFTMAAVIALAANAFSQEWKDASIFRTGDYPARSIYISYDNRGDADFNDIYKSKYIIPLNGTWKFSYYSDVNEINDSFHYSDYDDSDWKNIKIPGSIESQGYGNIKAKRSERKDVSRFRKSFEMPLPWRDRDVFLHIESAGNGTYVYVNGNKAGYFEDSKSAVEFNITDFVTEGTNSIAIECHSSCASSQIEDNDSSDLCGIMGDIYVYSQPKVHIDNYAINAVLDSNMVHGILNMEVYLVNQFNTNEALEVWYDIANEKGDIVKYYYAEIEELKGRGRDTVRFEAKLGNVDKWSSESPKLYTVTFRIKIDGRFMEYLPCKFGFKTIEHKNGKLSANGKPLKLKGVNYYGSKNDKKAVKEELTAMKANNINAIRTVTPQSEYFYELCDKMGFYVIDGININTSKSGYSLSKNGTLANDPKYTKNYLGRIENLYLRNRNHTSIIGWSTGYNGGNGINQYEAYIKMKQLDSTRFVIYDGAQLEWNSDFIPLNNPSLENIKSIKSVELERGFMVSSMPTDSLSIKMNAIKDNAFISGIFIDKWNGNTTAVKQAFQPAVVTKTTTVKKKAKK